MDNRGPRRGNTRRSRKLPATINGARVDIHTETIPKGAWTRASGEVGNTGFVAESCSVHFVGGNLADQVIVEKPNGRQEIYDIVDLAKVGELAIDVLNRRAAANRTS